MSQLQRYRIGTLKIFSNTQFSDEQLRQIRELVEHPVQVQRDNNPNAVTHDTVLSGRTAMCGGELDGIGAVVLKTYKRGGFFKFFLASHYLRLGQSRSRQEFKILQKVRALGVNAPEPVAYVEEGEMWYRAWLITKEIPSTESFIELSAHDEEKAIVVGHKVAAQVGQLITHRIHHVDFHPGNVVIDIAGEVHIVDFDKAYEFSGRRNELRDQYLRRWRRAVIKHHLPEILSEAISLELRDNYD